MLVVYVLTLNASTPEVSQSVSAAPRITRRITLEALEGWCVTLGRFDDADTARVEAAGYAARGAAGVVMPMDGAWQVLGALYGSEKQARRMAEKLKGEGTADADVLALTAGAVELRITAPENQIDLIAASDGLLRDQVGQLAALAQRLDRGEVQSEAAKTLCALSATESGELAAKLRACPGAAENGLCASLIDGLETLSRRLKDVVNSPNAAAASVSGMLRLVGIDTFTDLRDIRAGLGK